MGTTARAVRLLGMEEGQIEKLAVDSEGRLTEEALKNALGQGMRGRWSR